MHRQKYEKRAEKKGITTSYFIRLTKLESQLLGLFPGALVKAEIALVQPQQLPKDVDTEPFEVKAEPKTKLLPGQVVCSRCDKPVSRALWTNHQLNWHKDAQEELPKS